MLYLLRGEDGPWGPSLLTIVQSGLLLFLLSLLSRLLFPFLLCQQQLMDSEAIISTFKKWEKTFPGVVAWLLLDIRSLIRKLEQVGT